MRVLLVVVRSRHLLAEGDYVSLGSITDALEGVDDSPRERVFGAPKNDRMFWSASSTLSRRRRRSVMESVADALDRVSCKVKIGIGIVRLSARADNSSGALDLSA